MALRRLRQRYGHARRRGVGNYRFYFANGVSFSVHAGSVDIAKEKAADRAQLMGTRVWRIRDEHKKRNVWQAKGQWARKDV